MDEAKISAAVPSAKEATEEMVLTPEQEAAMAEYRKEIIQQGWSCEPADRPTAEAAFVKLYEKHLGKPVPEVWWCDGPTSASLARFVTVATYSDGIEAGKQAMRKALSLEFTEPVFDSFKKLIGSKEKLAPLLQEKADGDTELSEKNAEYFNAAWDWTFWGQYEIYWPAFSLWPDQNVKPLYTEDQRERLQLWLSFGQSCGWWHPYEKPSIVFACERHAHLHVDADDKPHCENGPCTLFRDGQEVFAWHGVIVPRNVIMSPESLTQKDVDAAESKEVAQVMLERMTAK